MVKLDFEREDDDVYHQYCFNCRAQTVERAYVNGNTFYDCKTCGSRQERSIVIDPAINWWVDDQLEYWHESAGVFVRDPSGKFLFFKRTIFPFVYTVPAGHVDKGEQPLAAAARELKEEVGVPDRNGLKLVMAGDIVGDSCRRGADSHAWHAYLLPLGESIDVNVAEEGGEPVWLTLAEAITRELTYPVEYIIKNFQDDLLG